MSQTAAQRSDGVQFRPATSHDLPSITALTADARDRLARWSPQWWRKSEAADVIHPMWLEHLVTNEPGTMHVATAGGEIMGCFGIIHQHTQWFLDDVSVRDDDHWPEFATALISYVDNRPALTCSAAEDEARSLALRSAGCEAVSAYWTQQTTTGTRDVGAADSSSADLPRPMHTFGGAPFDHTATDGLAFTTDAGTVIGSPPVTAPPVYEPGGTVTVIDLVSGSDLRALLDSALDVAGNRGDVLLCVVCDANDAELAQALDDCGFTRTVDVHQLPPL